MSLEERIKAGAADIKKALSSDPSGQRARKVAKGTSGKQIRAMASGAAAKTPEDPRPKVSAWKKRGF